MSRSLSPREKEVLSWALQGKSNWEISKILGISLSTTKAHLKRGYHKLGAHNRLGAAVALLQQGFDFDPATTAIKEKDNAKKCERRNKN